MKLVIKKFRLQHSLQHLGNNVQSASIIWFWFWPPTLKLKVSIPRTFFLYLNYEMVSSRLLKWVQHELEWSCSMNRGVNILRILKTRILKKKKFDIFFKLVRIQVLFQVWVFAAKTSKNPQNRDLGCTTTFKWFRDGSFI